jgi:serine/threonine protein kinase
VKKYKDNFFLVMEYCPGGDLFSYMEKRDFKIPEHRAASLVHKLMTAIYFLHSFGIVHRDIKPENVMMTDSTDESDIRLLDFGLSKIIGPNETCVEPFGTLAYVAPEVLLERPYNKSVDIWSLGIVTYLLLTGCLPFDDEKSEKEVAR